MIVVSNSKNIVMNFPSCTLTAAMFHVIGSKFRFFAEVRRASITTADAAKEMLADLECFSKNGEIVLIVEVKDRELTVSQIKSKIPYIRAKQVSEIFFVAQKGVSGNYKQEIEQLIGNEFVSGHNIYVFDLVSLGRAVLSLFGESGRREFIREVGNQLDEYHSDIKHRREWAGLIGGA